MEGIGVKSVNIIIKLRTAFGVDYFGEMKLIVNMQDCNEYAEFDYSCDGKTFNYRVPLVARTSNLGRGHLWFFRCLEADKTCKKLYMYKDRLVHRDMVVGGFYAAELESKEWRDYYQYLKKCKKLRSVIVQGGEKNYIRVYNGVTTKRAENIERSVQELLLLDKKDPGLLIPVW